jgi:hypothetical protein
MNDFSNNRGGVSNSDGLITILSPTAETRGHRVDMIIPWGNIKPCHNL